VGNLLHFSHAERRALPIAPEPTDVRALLGQIVAEFEPLAARGGSALRLEPGPAARATVDRAALRQVTLNLLDNAVKYGRPGQTVAVAVANDAAWLTLSVQDQGPGVAPGLRERVWQRFWRGEAARRTGVTGTGIGLAIVRELVQAHGGRVIVEDAPGGGARFVVRLPGRPA
jgi:signal transduction histidine kinase